MAYRPAQVYNGTGWDDIGDKRIGAQNGGIPQASVANLTTDLAAKANTVTQATAPTGNAQVIWYDSSTTPPTPKFWDGSAWQSFSTGGFLRAADVTGTTGSPTISTYTVGGIGYRVYKFTASGSITLSKSGIADALVVGGGTTAVASNYGGGGGGVRWGMFTLPSGASTITVGLKAAWPGAGGNTSLGSVVSVGGSRYYGQGPGGGGGVLGANAGEAGGGAGGSASGGTGGAGITSTLADGSTSVEYGKGGSTTGGASAPANTGGGGSGSGGLGADGVVIIRVRS